MAVELLYFARIREAIGLGSERVDLPSGVATVSDVIDWLVSRGPAYAEAFADRTRLRVAVDQQFAPLETAIAGAGEIALFPPVTGG